MSLFGDSIFGDEDLGQVALPEPATDDLISELAVTGGHLPSTAPATTKKPQAEAASMSWAPYAILGGGVLVAAVMIFSATRKAPTANRRRRARRKARR